MTREAYEKQNHFRRVNEHITRVNLIMALTIPHMQKMAELQKVAWWMPKGKDRNSGGNRRRNYHTMAVKRASKAKHNRSMRGG